MLTDALLAPGATMSLISVSRLEQKGFRVVFNNGRCTISKGKDVVATATMRNRLYHLDLAGTDSANFVHPPPDIDLWHQRFCHLNFASVCKLAQKDMVTGVDLKNASSLDTKTCKCEACLLGKMNRLPFPKSFSRASKPLELVHIDIWGKAPVQSIGRSGYFVGYTDDHSTYSKVAQE